METSFSILVWLRANRKNGKNESPLYGRITVNGKRVEIALKLSVEKERWDASKSCVKGNKSEAVQINKEIGDFYRRVRKVYAELLEKEEYITADRVANILNGRETEQKTLMSVFEKHNIMLERRIGIDRARATLVKFRTTCGYVRDFIKKNYNRRDISLRELGFSFIADFENYMKIEAGNGHNSTCKHLQRLKKVVNHAVDNEWLEKDPFKKYSIRLKKIDRGCLTEEELRKIEEKHFLIERLEMIRDVFVFSCYTGIAYIDVFNLTEDDISMGIDGEYWIIDKRRKTGSGYCVPLLPQAIAIIEKYKGNLKTMRTGKLLPVLSNQKTNAYLKEIADLCGIKKNLTFHLARHTFATTITLTNGVSIETVSKMLGHKDIKITQVYSKVVEKKVSNEMQELRAKLKRDIA